MSKNITISLTPAQAKVIYNVIDGALDAGACEGGNTAQEQRALAAVSMKLLDKRDLWRGVKLQEG